MKQTVIKTGLKQEDIDWSVPQWVTHNGMICLTTGNHSGSDFEGTTLPCGQHPKGHFADNWNKNLWCTLSGKLEIIIEN